MLCDPVLDWYRTQIPKFLTVVGLFSKISLHATICPLAFLTLRSLAKKYQNLERARASSVAQSFMRKSVGSGSAAEGRWRPTTVYWWNL